MQQDKLKVWLSIVRDLWPVLIIFIRQVTDMSARSVHLLRSLFVLRTGPGHMKTGSERQKQTCHLLKKSNTTVKIFQHKLVNEVNLTISRAWKRVRLGNTLTSQSFELPKLSCIDNILISPFLGCSSSVRVSFSGASSETLQDFLGYLLKNEMFRYDIQLVNTEYTNYCLHNYILLSFLGQASS